jgi:ubiquinone/menaquinone biosynthesis C-methylase UbiE/uncharacterized protein YbaR (Trm112 family)
MITTQMVADLVCPRSPGNPLDLSVTEQRGDRIIEGRLKCSACGTTHEIRSGVADLVPGDVVSDSNWREWNEHLAGFAARRGWRHEHPDRFSSKITNRSGSLQKAFAEFVNIESGTVLDVGCGPGNFRKHLGPEVAYYGIDPLPLIETENIPSVRAIAEYLPFRDAMFTDIVVMAALDHFQDVEAFCREAVRVLVAGGRLHIVQSIHEIRGPITAVKFAAHEIKDFLETRQTRAESRAAPKHMGEYDRKSLRETLDKWFKLTSEERFSKRWYSPENLFLTLTARS